MLEKIIELSVNNRFLVIIFTVMIALAGIYSLLSTPVDAIPDLSDAQVIIFTPIFMPVITAVGISPIHFAIIFVVNAEVGFLTPPLGTNLFVSMEIADTDLGGVAKSVAPLLGVLFLMIMVIVLFPQISLFLPELLAG